MMGAHTITNIKTSNYNIKSSYLVSIAANKTDSDTDTDMRTFVQ